MSLTRNRIMVTGIGVISAAGRGLAETMESFKHGRRNGAEASIIETGLKCPVFEVKDIPDVFHLEGRRTLTLALCAVDEALKDAQLKDNIAEFRVGVCIGTTVASQLNDIKFYKSLRNTGYASMIAIDRYVKGNLANFISRKIKSKGPSLTVVNACSSGTDALGVALLWLKNGLCDIAIVGGSDELSLIPLCGFNALGVIDKDLCTPFDKTRKGLNLGEGAGVLAIETRESAQKRKKFSNLFVAGYGSASDAYHLTAPRPDGTGLEMAIKNALNESTIEPHDISFVNAHGTGTIENDLVEGRVLGKLFGSKTKVLSTKGFTGHTLGAAGGIEAVFTVAALKEAWIPVSAGFRKKDENIPITPVKEKTDINGNYALSTSLAFGGNNGALVFGREL